MNIRYNSRKICLIIKSSRKRKKGKPNIPGLPWVRESFQTCGTGTLSPRSAKSTAIPDGRETVSSVLADS